LEKPPRTGVNQSPHGEESKWAMARNKKDTPVSGKKTNRSKLQPLSGVNLAERKEESGQTLSPGEGKKKIKKVFGNKGINEVYTSPGRKRKRKKKNRTMNWGFIISVSEGGKRSVE